MIDKTNNNNENVKVFLNALLRDMKKNENIAKSHNPKNDIDIVIMTSLAYSQGYIKEFAKRNGIEL